jgi:hypothetical protein
MEEGESRLSTFFMLLRSPLHFLLSHSHAPATSPALCQRDLSREIPCTHTHRRRGEVDPRFRPPTRAIFPGARGHRSRNVVDFRCVFHGLLHKQSPQCRSGDQHATVDQEDRIPLRTSRKSLFGEMVCEGSDQKLRRQRSKDAHGIHQPEQCTHVATADLNGAGPPERLCGLGEKTGEPGERHRDVDIVLFQGEVQERGGGQKTETAVGTPVEVVERKVPLRSTSGWRINSRRCAVVLVPSLLCLAVFKPAIPLLFGLFVLAACFGCVIHTLAESAKLMEKCRPAAGRASAVLIRLLQMLPVVQHSARRLLGVASLDQWQSRIRLATCVCLAVLLFTASYLGSTVRTRWEAAVARREALEVERVQRVAKADAAVERLLQASETALKAGRLTDAERMLTEAAGIPEQSHSEKVTALQVRLADAKVAALLDEARGALNFGELDRGQAKLQEALAVKGAENVAEVKSLLTVIEDVTDPVRVRSVLMELSDADFERVKAQQELPLSVKAVTFPCVREKFVEVAGTVMAEVETDRESRRLAAVEAEEKRQAEVRLEAERALKIAEKREATVADEKARKDAVNLRSGQTAYLEVKGESVVWLAVDEGAFEQLNSLSAARDEQAITQMMQAGRVLVCRKQTKVVVVVRGVFSTTVRVLEGKHENATGVIPNEFLHVHVDLPKPIPETEPQESPSVSVRSSRLVDFVNPNIDKKMRMLIVTLKNTGNVPVRVVDADITWLDASGNVLGSINYTIYIEFDSAPGIEPGKTWTTKKDEGFILPLSQGGDRAKKVEVRVTKVLQQCEM